MTGNWRFGLGFVALLVLVVVLVGRPDGRDQGDPLSPDGTGPTGARAAVLLLEEQGVAVDTDVVVPEAGVDRALLLQDQLDDDRRRLLQAWVSAGGTLVVADPLSPLAPPLEGELGVLGFDDVDIAPGDCTIDELADVGTVAPRGAVVFAPRADAEQCFADEDGAFVLSVPVGDGRVIGVGSQGPFLNDRLDEADNAVLVARLLAPETEGASVAFLDPAGGRVLGDGDESLVDLVPRRVLLALLQLAIAFLVYVAFRARRAGRPVAEPLPTTIAGSELVAAVGELRLQERAPERSAALLRDDLHRTLARRLGLAPDAPVDELVAVAERAGADPDRLRAVLDGPPVADDDDLVRLILDIDLTRQEILHEPV